MSGLKQIIKLTSITSIALALCHCASSQQGGQQSSGELSEQGFQGQGVASNASLNGAAAKNAAGGNGNSVAEGGSTNNFAAANSGNGGSNAALGESLNNVPIENPAASASNALPLNAPLNTAATPLNAAATNLAATENTAATNTAAPVNTVATETATAPAAQNSSARAEASPFKNPQMNWPGKGKVKYATRHITRHASPNGPVVGEFDQGEHPLVYQNGNWVELNDGSFVKGNGLSDKAVGYSKGKASWR
jgi:hypothetical protein